MLPLKNNEIFGNWATVLLPLQKDDSINYSMLAAQVDLLIASGVNGIYSNGTAGEFYSQTAYEFERISEILAEKCTNAEMPFQIGCSHTSPNISLERVKRVKHLKPGAIQLILPDWYRPSIEESIYFLKLISDIIAPVGIVLYNPGHAKRKLLPGDYETLLNADINLVGCKTTGGDDEWYHQMNNIKSKLSVFVPGHKLATGICKGAQGAYSNVSCLNPKAAQHWYGLMLENMDAALQLQQRIQHFIFNHILPYITTRQYSDQAADKFMAAVGGWTNISTHLKWPYHSIAETDVLPVRKICEQILPEFFNMPAGS
ncbi:MAG: dihydrodipicolinate synthase family protein [Sphingobacteriales bacterium 41-5]|nr:MAG: dihydrodipicolinate synthase family protein [Sphingobacteriales bacterium 41-5]